jgi:site-specific DNA recombinase
MMMFIVALVVIYARFSSDLQSKKSCEDQEREVREGLTRMGIDHSNAIVIIDEAQSGTKVDRDGFVRLKEMANAGEIAILAVDDQSRLSRSNNVFAFVTDLKYNGGRFISTGEGIDSEQVGWELRVKVMELHNSTTISELGRRVHRGQLGRILNDCSAGDLCYGYESYLENPEAALTARGGKPPRAIRNNEEEAKWVRQIFEWFNAGRSIRWIADELTRLEAPKGARRKLKRWKRCHVRKILGNPKYAGLWAWGATRTIRDSRGRTKQIPVPEEDRVVRERPELRIISEEVWNKAQSGLQVLKNLYGSNPGQKPRGPKVHHTALYPDGLLPGLVFCSYCGSRMWQKNVGAKVFFFCPNHGSEKGDCKMVTQVSLEKAEAAILDSLAQLLTAWPEWGDKVVNAMRQRIEEVTKKVPEQVRADESRLKKVEEQIENLTYALSESRSNSKSVLEQLESFERDAKELGRKIEAARRILDAPAKMPSDAWIQEQIDDVSLILHEESHESVQLLRRIVGHVEADQVISHGKKRGFPRIRFRVNGMELLKDVLKGSDANGLLEFLPQEASLAADSREFVISLGKMTPMDRWAPKIAEMRANGVKWTKIVEITGLDLNRAYIAWKRYVEAQGGSTTSGPDDDCDEACDSDEAA